MQKGVVHKRFLLYYTIRWHEDYRLAGNPDEHDANLSPLILPLRS